MYNVQCTMYNGRLRRCRSPCGLADPSVACGDSSPFRGAYNCFSQKLLIEAEKASPERGGGPCEAWWRGARAHRASAGG
ncbi:MAG: hypothetical protein LUE20_07585 [Oscillospiraceae bacterium]|nr:hypothetical protein [Oscillospiraceae bacterium]